jgi:hypothetical protein
MCETCPKNHSHCTVVTEYDVYRVDSFDQVSGEDKMLQEIFQRGPITCGIAAPATLDNYTEGIYTDATNDTKIVHEVSIIGFGVENGTKYWNVRNTWGSHWGEEGFFKVVRGVNALAIETDCSYAVPKDTWTPEMKHIPTEAEMVAANKINRLREAESLLFAALEPEPPVKQARTEGPLFPRGEKPPPVMAWETGNLQAIPFEFTW